MAAEKSSSKRQAWFCAIGLPSDIVIEVGDMNFHLHKFPLMSKSRKIHQLITQHETKSSSPAATTTTTKFQTPPDSTVAAASEEKREEKKDHEIEEEEEEGDEDEKCYIILPDFPGGSDTFEMAAKFCYGVKIDLSAVNVAPLRCAGEYLEMTEEYSEDNLISKTELFFSQVVFKNLRESVKALKSCERVMSYAEGLGITQRCLDSMVSLASSTDPGMFGWPVSDGGAAKDSNQSLWNGIDTGLRRKSLNKGGVKTESWFEDLAQVSLPLFKRLILSMRARDLNPDIIESCLMYYAKRYIPGISRSNRKSSAASALVSENEQRILLETIIANLPLEKSSQSSTATRFLFGLLRNANILDASEACRAALEKKIGSQLDQATLDDLLIPSYSYLKETLYDVDCVERILGYYLDGLSERNSVEIEAEDGDTESRGVHSPDLMRVGRLIDGYISEIASDGNLKPDKFYNLAISLPDQARIFDDGLYRAVDVYLKAHPWIPEEEREKLCGVMDCQKLTLEACTHAAQNERLPLRAVVQVLFFEQLQLRHAIAGTLLSATTETGRPSVMMHREIEEREVVVVEEERRNEEEDTGIPAASPPPPPAEEEEDGSRWKSAVKENQVLRLDMDSMRTRVHQLERECSTMKKVIEKIDKTGPREGGKAWSLTKKLGCKFKTQVCDSHESAVVESRKGRHHHHNHHHHQQ